MGKTDPITPRRVTVFPLSPAVLAGIGAILIAIVLAFVSTILSIIPLVLFVLLCLIAPFFPWLRFFMPVVTRGDKNKNAVSLTFDDGPSPETTHLLLGLLEKYGIHATHFVIGSKAAAYPELINEILSKGHDIGNHTMNHDVFLMLRSSNKLGTEIEKCQDALEAFGVRPLTFRPPAGIINPRLWPQLLSRGLYCVTFSCRALDRGNHRVSGIARRIVRQVKAGDIIMLHDCAPKNNETAGHWLKEVEQVITGIRAKGLRIVSLSGLLGRPVMVSSAEAFSGNTARGRSGGKILS